MKKRPVSILVTVTIVFFAFTLGFFLGRGGHHAPVQVRVPEAMQTQPTAPLSPTEDSREPEAPVEFPVDINAAGLRELTALPGIGEVLAQRILDCRRENGPFQSIDGLLAVEGIGQKKFENILELITIGGTA